MNKLVRDKVAVTIEARGNVVHKRRLGDEEFVEQLLIKLKEEAAELAEVAPGDRSHFAEELADVKLIVDTLFKTTKLSTEEFGEIQKRKVAAAGGFEEKTFIERVELQDEDPWIAIYRQKGFREIK